MEIENIFYNNSSEWILVVVCFLRFKVYLFWLARWKSIYIFLRKTLICSLDKKPGTFFSKPNVSKCLATLKTKLFAKMETTRFKNQVKRHMSETFQDNLASIFLKFWPLYLIIQPINLYKLFKFCEIGYQKLFHFLHFSFSYNLKDIFILCYLKKQDY